MPTLPSGKLNLISGEPELLDAADLTGPAGKGLLSPGRVGRGLLRWLPRFVVLLVIVIFVRFLITSPTLKWHVVEHYFTSTQVLQGLLRTIYLTVIAMAVGIVLGCILAVMRLSTSLLVSGTSSFYIWFFRGTPLLVQIIFWYNLASFIPRLSIGIPFGGPQFASWNTNSLITPLVAAILGLGLNEGAYMAEIVRAGIMSVDSGQMEASLALGMTRGQAMRRIVLPQALRVIIPPTGNQAIGMLKGTSLVSVISTPELLYSVQAIYAQNYQTIPLLIVASIWYLILTSALSFMQYFVELRLARGQAQRPPTPRQRLQQGVKSLKLRMPAMERHT